MNLPNGSVISYKTDGENKRFARLINGVVQTMYSYNNQGQLVSEHNADGTLRSRYIYGTQAHSPDYMIKNNVRYSLIKDHLGSIRLVMNTTTGAIAQQLNYDEFGIVTLDSNPLFQTFGYAGGLYDSSTSLVRFGAREYDAESGRWLQKDPIRFQGGDTNLYGYVGQDPINYVDPSGKFWTIIAGAVIGAVSNTLEAQRANLSTRQTIISAIVGATTGALAGTGVGLVQSILLSGATGAFNNAANQIISNAKAPLDLTRAGQAGAFSAIGGIAGAGATALSNRLFVQSLSEGLGFVAGSTASYNIDSGITPRSNNQCLGN